MYGWAAPPRWYDLPAVWLVVSFVGWVQWHLIIAVLKHVRIGIQ